MKIIAIGRNYVAHALELNNLISDSPVIFIKPDTALLKDNKPFYYPDFSSNIHHEIEVVLKICKEGKHIAEKYANNYFEEIALGIDFTARDIQDKHKKEGLPWELAKAFDHSAPVSSFISKNKFHNITEMGFHLEINGQVRQVGNTRDMIFSFEKIISFVSKHITLKKGDMIFTGTPQGVGPVNIGDHLIGYIEDMKLLDFEIK